MFYISFLCFILLFSACKTDTKEQTSAIETDSELKKELTTAENIAQAHGFENWKHVNDIQFTFNVDRDSSHFERSWTWNPKSDDVRLVTDTDTIQYNRTSYDII